MKKIAGIILAAGTSSRFDSTIPKQLYMINDKSVLQYSIDSMCDFVDELVVVINKDIKFDCTTNKCKITFIENNINIKGEKFFRWINEVPTILFLLIVFLVVFQPNI